MKARSNPSNNSMSDVSPKDVKQLEVLKPHSTPSMWLRHKQSLDKEKRLEMTSRPIQKASSVKEERKEHNAQKMAKTTAKESERKSTKKMSGKHAEKKKHVHAPRNELHQEDQVEEGINWSDEDE
mmetsp:Transcript_14933/g.24141  ORF Transcript_14933/g.24141 Transcript_14933/m.24141 type:complete len:125 (+) Transcript_14933:2369-2743(+)